jgi:hypothetical protein
MGRKAKKANGMMRKPIFTFAQGYASPVGSTTLFFPGKDWSKSNI